LEVVPPVKGTALAELLIARGAAFGDLFNDGKVDVVINQLDGSPALFRNVSPDKNHWVGFKLIGGPKSPVMPLVLRVYLTIEGVRQRADVISGGSYALLAICAWHFGLGQSTASTTFEIHWPSGSVERITFLDRPFLYTIEEGKALSHSSRYQPPLIQNLFRSVSMWFVIVFRGLSNRFSIQEIVFLFGLTP